MTKFHQNINPWPDHGSVHLTSISAPTGPLPATITDPIAYLIRRKFYCGQTGLERFGIDRLLAMASHSQRKAVEAYRRELQARRPEELSALVDAELARQASEEEPQPHQTDQDRFFNLPGAKADFDRWSRLPLWSLEGAVALWFGKDPNVVTWKRVEPHLQFSPFAAEYRRIRELAYDARERQLLDDYAEPDDFIAWAKRAGIPFPADLVAAVSANETVDYWRMRYYRLEERIGEGEEQDQANQAIIERQRAAIDELTYRCVDCANELKAVRAAQDADRSKPPATGARVRETLLKLVIVMAKNGYKYDPKKQRNDAVAEIVGDLERAGMPLDANTVRKYLSEGASLLPRE
jgi:predicted nucleic acid-binding Zn ribbon protein